ncbi:cytokinin dehydrogenase 3-like protein [Tanacetum coccineum]
MDLEDTMNDDTPIGVASAVQEGVTPYVADMTVEMEKQNSLEDTTVLESFPPLSTPVTTEAGNAPGKSSYANVIGKPGGKKLNIHTLFTPRGNGMDVVVLIESIRATSDQFANTTYGFFLGKRVGYPVIANYVRNTWDAMLENGLWFILNNPLIMKKWHPDENLLKEDVNTIPVWVKLHGVPVTAFSDDGLSAIATKLGTPLMLDSYTSDMCMQSGRATILVIFMLSMSGNPLGVRVVRFLDMSMRNVQRISMLSTANTYGKEMNKSESTKEVSMLNPFEVLTSVDNDVDLGTNRGISNSADKGTNNVSSSNTPIDEKTDKIEQNICEGKLRLVDDDGNPLVPTRIVESNSEVEVVFDETANLRISTSGKDGSDKGYGTNSLLE